MKQLFKKHTVMYCWSSEFMGVPCMESLTMLGFWKDPNDLRPSSATWLKKVKKNGQYPIFKAPPLNAHEDIEKAKGVLQ